MSNLDLVKLCLEQRAIWTARTRMVTLCFQEHLHWVTNMVMQVYSSNVEQILETNQHISRQAIACYPTQHSYKRHFIPAMRGDMVNVYSGRSISHPSTRIKSAAAHLQGGQTHNLISFGGANQFSKLSPHHGVSSETLGIIEYQLGPTTRV